MVKEKSWSEVEQNVSCQQSFDSSTAYTHWSEQFFCVLFTQLLMPYVWGSGALCGKLVFRNKMTVLQASSENHVLVPEFWKELFVNQLLYNCTFCLTKQFVFVLMFICRWWRRQNRGMSNWNWLPLLCVYLHTLKCYSQWHNFWDIDIKWPKVFVWEKQPGCLQFPLSKAKVEGGLFFTSFRKLESGAMLFVGREKWPALSSFKWKM